MIMMVMMILMLIIMVMVMGDDVGELYVSYSSFCPKVYVGFERRAKSSIFKESYCNGTKDLL